MDARRNYVDSAYIKSEIDTGCIISYYKRIYRLYDAKKRLIEKGEVGRKGVDQVCKTGKWLVFDTTGQLLLSCSYYQDRPIGDWIEYYSNGNIKKNSNYSTIDGEGISANTCLSGNYEEYYSKGGLKISGYYNIASDTFMTDTFVIVDPVSGLETYRITELKVPRSRKLGNWRYYNESGELLKEENW